MSLEETQDINYKSTPVGLKKANKAPATAFKIQLILLQRTLATNQPLRRVYPITDPYDINLFRRNLLPPNLRYKLEKYKRREIGERQIKEPSFSERTGPTGKETGSSMLIYLEISYQKQLT